MPSSPEIATFQRYTVARRRFPSGIANRGFERRFELADFVRVASADLADGLLAIDLVREVPEAMKPKKIRIGGQPSLEVVRDDDERSDAA